MQELLGKYIVHKIDGKEIIGRIVEAEAYKGAMDKAAIVIRIDEPTGQVMLVAPGYSYVF